MKTVAVIGAGPAGMMAAIAAADAGAAVTLFEKNEKVGKKLFITGKGRCNLTNACDVSELFSNVVSNEKFLYSALYSFTNQDTCAFFEGAGLALKEERGQRVFPQSDHSSDVIRTLEKELKKRNVKICLRREIKSLEELDFDSIIIATGGISYASTGSTGDGYKFAEKLGHRIVEPVPALVPLVVKEDFVKRLEGLSLRNVSVKIKSENGKTVHEGFGEMLFTSRGVSGPLILTTSSIIGRRLTEKKEKFTLSIDLKPALDEKTLDTRILRDFEGEKNKIFGNSLSKLLPSKLIPVIVELSGIPSEKRVNEITKAERMAFVELLKNFKMTIEASEGFNQAVITQGGVAVNKVNPSTMESKLQPGVYFAGEVLDVDAFTGGFNIQIALSTGWLAGKSAAEE